LFDKKVFIEAIKEPLRVLVLAIIPFAIAYFGSISYEWAGIIVVILRFIDKYLYELGKATNNPKLEAGLTRF